MGQTTASAQAAPPAARSVPTDRLNSLDAYRGFVMLLMISAGLGLAKLEDDPTWGWLGKQVEHAAWEGCTFWDLIQPSFMFIVGVAMPYAYARRATAGDSWWRQAGHAVKRALLLIAIGVFLDTYAEGRIYVQFIRVLQQIALAYLIVFPVLHRGPLVQAITAVALLVGHTSAFLVFGMVEGQPAWVRGDNFGSHLDIWLHLPPSTGGYATFNAVSSAATILFGVLAGELFRGPWSRTRKLLVITTAGLVAVTVGLLLAGWVPMIKRLWTASFTVYAAGLTCLLMAVFYAAIDLWGQKRWAFPLVIVGMNSIAAYVMAGVFRGNIDRALKAFLNEPLARLGDGRGLVLAILGVFALWLACYWLYRQRIFFKV